jgi:hypothetical protein
VTGARSIALLAATVLLGGCSNSSTAVHPSPSAVSSPSPFVSPSPVARQVLPPARSLPVVALCSQPVTTQPDGTAGPLICSNGGLNVQAWKFFVPLTPRVLSAGPAVSLTGLQTAMCRDVNVSHATVAQETSAYELAAAYNGWSFATDPTNVLATSGCPR